MDFMSKFLLWYFYCNILATHAEWVELPKVKPSTKQQKKINVNKNENFTNEAPITLDMNMGRILMQVHKTLTEEGRSSIDGKENFLKKLQSHLLSKIWGESSVFWSRTGIEGRGYGHVMAFPSLEGALMTISFLTFAVFLIKIVKQCLQGLQTGGNVVGIELPAAMVTPAKVVKHKRNTDKKGVHKNLQCSKIPPMLQTRRLCSPIS